MKFDVSKLQPYLPFVKSILITALIAGLITIYPILIGSEPINWLQVGLVFVVALVFSIAHSIDKYLQPSQPDLANVVDSTITALEKRYQPTVPTTPLQGHIQGPLVVVHAAQALPSPMPQNNAQMTVGAGNVMTWPTTSQPSESNLSAFEDTAPRPIVQKDPS